MDNHVAEGSANATTLLAQEFTRRINQLGLSRRELTKRTGLSRQTLHNVEHGGSTELKPATMQAIDKGLYWRLGTCLALLNGGASVLDDDDVMMQADKESAYRWRIVERIQRMSLTDLERMVAVLEGEAFGDSESPMSTDVVIDKVEEAVMRRIEQRMKLWGDIEQGKPS